ncbi:hypothetical protein ACV1C6_20275 [Aeromonas sanarellii]
MKLFDAFTEKGYHTSLISTFSLDFDAFESIVLARLREAGSNNNILIADARMLSQALGEEGRPPRFAGRRYSVAGVLPEGVFHSKLVVQLGKKAGRLLVASANMTAAGLAGNLEAVGEVTAGDDNPRAAALLRAAFDYLVRFLPEDSVSRRQANWALQRTPWLPPSVPGDASTIFEDGTTLALLCSGPGSGIGARFMERVGARRVTRLIAISPYWDSTLRALGELRSTLQPEQTSVVIQPKTEQFPGSHWPKDATVQAHDARAIRGVVAGRFVHAKVLIAQTLEADCVLFGSANCTVAALGIAGVAGINEEACLYRELAPGEALSLLGLADVLQAPASFDVQALNVTPIPELPMDVLVRQLPGRMELSGSVLKWWPPAGVAVAEARIFLFDSLRAPIDAQPVRIGQEQSPVRFHFEAIKTPHFARVVATDFESSLMVIAAEAAIQEAQRRQAGRAIEKHLAFLDDDSAEEGLWLLESIKELARLESEQHAPPERIRSHETPGKVRDSSPAGVILTFDEFMKGRATHEMPQGRSSSHLSATHQESVRSFLNALIGSRASFLEEEAEFDAAHLSNPDVEEPDDDPGSGQAPAPRTTKEDEADKAQLRLQRQYVKDTQKDYKEKVESFLKAMQATAAAGELCAVDRLRLRAFLMAVLGAGSLKTRLLPTESGAVVSRRQVLPSMGDESWQRLVGRMLYEFFNKGASPLVTRFKNEEADTTVAEDVVECWATCCWAVCAIRVAVSDEHTLGVDLEKTSLMAQRVYLFSWLVLGAEFDEGIETMFARLTRRYATRLGVDELALMQEHLRLREQALHVRRSFDSKIMPQMASHEAREGSLES